VDTGLGSRMGQRFALEQSSLRAASIGAALILTGSTSFSALASTTGQDRAKQSRAADVVSLLSGVETPLKAVVRFSRYASRVTLLVRGSTLSASMSHYLASKVSEIDNVDVRTRTEVVALEADTRLRAIMLSSPDETEFTRLPLESLFVCIGGVPRMSGLVTLGLATDDAGYVLTGADVTGPQGALNEWPLSRSPLPLETNRPGVFAAGDVRSGSIKRCSAAIGEGSMAVALVHHRLAELGGEQ
jgi:thioredoxin reductase (NADPH)